VLPEVEARLPIQNRGFLYGDGCFETIRIHHGAPFRLDAHFGRLRQGLEILQIEFAWPLDQLRQGARKIAESNGVVEGLIRITITAGERPTARGNATITSREFPEIPLNPALHVSTAARRISGPMSQCKSISRSVESAALREAQAEGAFDAILRNEKGRVVETTARNLFLAKDGVLWTPPTYEGALPGVTRAAVLEIARREKIRLKEASVSLERLQSADEVFVTGSGVGVLAIGSVDGHRYEVAGPLTPRIRTEYEALLDRESAW
jgi:branched-chain amino acid aminotransferase